MKPSARCLVRLFDTMGAGLRRLLLVAGLSLLASCGGGGLADLAGGVGSGGSGLAEGTVTGFGSVIVDGVRFDDSQANVTEEGPGGVREATLKIGQRVRIRSSANNVAESIEVITELVGPIDQIVADGAQAQRLTVLGQQVRVQLEANANGAAATWTDFGDLPCAPGCAFAANQWIQAHGTWVLDGASNTYMLLASRVEVINPQAKVLVSGVVSKLDGSVVRLNAATGREVDLGSTAAVAEQALNQVVRVWAPPPGGQPAAVIQADRSISAKLAPPANVTSTVLGGEVSRVSADGAEIEIQGNRITVPVEFRGAISTEQFARVELEKSASGWQMKGPPRLTGNIERAEVQISEDIPVARLAQIASGNWSLRGTLLARIALPSSCTQLANDPPGTKVRVAVQAIRGPLPMKVQSVQCSRS